MNKESIRTKAADFLEEHIRRVEKILEDKTKGFYFGLHVKEWDKTKGCAAIGGVEGWLPVSFPELAIYDFRFYNGRTYNDETDIGVNFDSEKLGLKWRLWYSLTLPWDQDIIDEEKLSSESNFHEVAALWKRTAARIRKGELDNLLIF